MKKWTVALITVVLLTFALSTTANAAQSRALSPSVTLYFEGTTAYCNAVVIDVGKSLNINMELWHGDVLVDSWPSSGEGKAVAEGSCQVVKGQTYTLIVTGTTNGKPFSSTPFSRIC